MAEAPAAVTSALAFPNGAAPEIIDHGRTGYLCRDEDEMTAAVARVHQISRWQCRAAAERRFSLARIAAAMTGCTGPSWNTPDGRPRADRNERTVTVPAARDRHRDDFHPERTGGAAPRTGSALRPDGAIGGTSAPGSLRPQVRPRPCGGPACLRARS